MKKEDIEMWDWDRILFGAAPPIFILEVFLRTIVTFLILLVVLRLLGKKMNGQLNLTETSVMITLGAIVSVPMQMPDRGVVVGIVALLCILIFQRAVNWLTTKSEKIEDLTQGTIAILVRDGVIDLKAMAHTGVSKQELFASLREKEYHNLGSAKRVYFEACGLMNVYKEQEKKAGLAIYPSDERRLMEHSELAEDKMACRNCGYVTDHRNEQAPCKNCGESQWMPAIY